MPPGSLIAPGPPPGRSVEVRIVQGHVFFALGEVVVVLGEERRDAVAQRSPSNTVGGADQYWGIQMNTNTTTHHLGLLESKPTILLAFTAPCPND